MKTAALSTHEHIRLEAYLLSEQAGHPAGMDEIFWTQAEAIVHGRTAVVAGAGKAVKVKAQTVAAAKPAKKPVVAAREPKATPKKEEAAQEQAKPAAKRKK